MRRRRRRAPATADGSLARGAPLPVGRPWPEPDPALFDKVVNLCKRRGFVFPSAEIYGGFRSTYDYGPLGVLLLRNVKDAWWRSMVQLRDDVVGLDAAILGAARRSGRRPGHLANFTDPLVDCRNCKERFRLDKLEDPDTCPNCGKQGHLHRGPPVQPHVQDPRRPGRGRRRRGLPAARDGPGHVRQLQERARDEPQEAAVRHRPGRQVVPQRDHARQLRLPHPRVRADGDGVLRAARRGPAVVRVLVRRAHATGTATSACPPTSCACGPTTPTS